MRKKVFSLVLFNDTQTCSVICFPLIKVFSGACSSHVKLRTRSSLLESLHNELFSRSRCMMGDPSVAAAPPSESTRGPPEGSGGFIENFKVNTGTAKKLIT